MTVNTLDQIDLGYMKIRQVKKYSDHILLAYRLKNEDGFKQGGSSDKEYYGDQEVLKIIKRKHAVNVAVFIARDYGGVPLGPIRFKIIRALAGEVLEELEPEVIPPDQEPKNTQLRIPRCRRRRTVNYSAPQNVWAGNPRGRGGGGYRGGPQGRGGPRARGRGAQGNPMRGGSRGGAQPRVSPTPHNQHNVTDQDAAE